MLEKGKIQDVAQVTAAMIVLGGTLGAVLVTTPLPVLLRATGPAAGRLLRAIELAPKPPSRTSSATPPRPARTASSAWRRKPPSIPDPFLRKALSLAVDGTDLQEMRNMMEIDIALGEQSAEAEAKVWEAAGGYAPTIGIIGAVMGLIQVMKHLEDIKEVGHGIAVAFVATVYGVGCANIFFLPVGQQAAVRACTPPADRDMTLEGVHGNRGGPESHPDPDEAGGLRHRSAASPRRARRRTLPRQPAQAAPPRTRRAHATRVMKRNQHYGTRQPRALAGFLRRFHHPAVRLLCGDVRLHPGRPRQGRARFPQSVREALEHGAVLQHPRHRARPRQAREPPRQPLNAERVETIRKTCRLPARPGRIPPIFPNRSPACRKAWRPEIAGGKIRSAWSAAAW